MKLSTHKPTLLVAGLACLVFGVDVFLPLGIGEWAFYLLPLLLWARRESPPSTAAFTLLLVVLMLVGLYLSPPGAPIFYVATSYEIGFGVLIIVGLLAASWRRAELDLTKSRLATLNIMEDAVAARSLAEAANQDLKREVENRKRASAQLLKSSVAVEQSPVSVMITDTDGAIEYVNPEFLRLTGYAAEEVLGRNPRLLKSGGTPPETHPQLWATITAGRVWRGEFCNRKKNGELYWETAVISPVRSETGEITHFLAVKEDITARKQTVLQLEAFSHLGHRLSSAKTVPDAARVIADAADQLLGWDAYTFDLYSPENDRIDSVLSIDTIAGRRADVPPTYTGACPTPRMPRAIDSGGYLILRQQSDERLPDSISFGDLSRRSASIILVSIRDHSGSIAVLSIQRYSPERTTTTH